jgi:hypothetical protein
MDEKDKDLLLKDICGRLRYGVKTSYSGYEMIIRGVDIESKTVDVIDWGKARFAAVRIEKIKPYLRSLDSMTAEEAHEIGKILWDGFNRGVEIRTDCISIVDSDVNIFTFLEMQAVLDYLNKKMFDINRLIPKGMAVEMPKEMYSVTKNKDEM